MINIKSNNKYFAVKKVAITLKTFTNEPSLNKKQQKILLVQQVLCHDLPAITLKLSCKPSATKF